MTENELLARLRDAEDNFVERKSAGVGSAKICQTAVAFANSTPPRHAAVLFIGIHDTTGAITGVRDTDDLQKRIASLCEKEVYPAIIHTTQVLWVESKEVVAVVFPVSERRPHFAGGAFVRIGSENKRASSEQYEELILSRTDKAREILRYKNLVISVRGIGYRLGTIKPMDAKTYVEGAECRIVSCTAHVVTLQNIATSQRYSEPLGGVTISRDEDKYRPMLLISCPAP